MSTPQTASDPDVINRPNRDTAAHEVVISPTKGRITHAISSCGSASVDDPQIELHTIAKAWRAGDMRLEIEKRDYGFMIRAIHFTQ